MEHWTSYIPDFGTGTTCAIFHEEGKTPVEKGKLKSFDRERCKWQWIATYVQKYHLDHLSSIHQETSARVGHFL